MKKVILTIGILAGVSSTFAQESQVGVNTTNCKEKISDGRIGINTDKPKATLHIAADNDNNDINSGLIIPDVSMDKLNAEGHEESTLVYYSGGSNSAYINQNETSTTENIGSKKGFYYYNHDNNDKNDWQRIIRKAQFYMPSIVVPTTIGEHKIDLYEEYMKQYGHAHNNVSNIPSGISMPSNRPIASSMNASPLKTYRRDDLDYFVVYYDNNVFTKLKLNIEENGVLKTGVLNYEVTAESAKNISAQTFMNIVLQER